MKEREYLVEQREGRPATKRGRRIALGKSPAVFACETVMEEVSRAQVGLTAELGGEGAVIRGSNPDGLVFLEVKEEKGKIM